jgi:hypothetical protein
MTSSMLFPNLFVMLVGHPGVGKSRTIGKARGLIKDLPQFFIAPMSMTWASLVDALIESKQCLIMPPMEPVEFNSMYICADEMGAFIHKYDHEMTDGLSYMFYPEPYSQRRRTKELKVMIKSPQINMICGSTPQNLADFLPEKAWGQGFMSRVIMIFSDERPVGDDFAPLPPGDWTDLSHDLETINRLYGQFHVLKEYAELVKAWRQGGQVPTPTHPKLMHYNSRRKEFLYKLSMIAAVDHSDSLVLGEAEFVRAIDWLQEAEVYMEEIFKAGATNADAQGMEEILHYVIMADRGQGVAETAINRVARNHIPLHSITRVIDILERSGQLRMIGQDRRTEIKYYSARSDDRQ